MPSNLPATRFFPASSRGEPHDEASDEDREEEEEILQTEDRDEFFLHNNSPEESTASEEEDDDDEDEVEILVRVDPAQRSWWWTFMRVRYTFLFCMVFITCSIFLLSVQSQLLMWLFYQTTTTSTSWTHGSGWHSFTSALRWHPLEVLETLGLCLALAMTPLLAALVLHTLSVLVSDAWSAQCCPAFRALLFKVWCGGLLQVPGVRGLPQGMRRGIIRMLAILGDLTVLCIDILPCTYGVLSIAKGRPLYDTGQQYLKVAFVTAFAEAGLFLLLDWGKKIRQQLLRAWKWRRGEDDVRRRRRQQQQQQQCTPQSPSAASAAVASTVVTPIGRQQHHNHHQQQQYFHRSPRPSQVQRALREQVESFVPYMITQGGDLQDQMGAGGGGTCSLQQELLGTNLDVAWYKRPSQRQLQQPVMGSWRHFSQRRRAPLSATTDWLADPSGPPMVSANYSLNAKGHFRISYDHPAYEGRLGVTLWHCLSEAAVSLLQGARAALGGACSSVVPRQSSGGSDYSELLTRYSATFPTPHLPHLPISRWKATGIFLLQSLYLLLLVVAANGSIVLAVVFPKSSSEIVLGYLLSMFLFSLWMSTALNLSGKQTFAIKVVLFCCANAILLITAMNPQVQTEEYDWTAFVKDVEGTCEGYMPERYPGTYQSCTWDLNTNEDLKKNNLQHHHHSTSSYPPSTTKLNSPSSSLSLSSSPASRSQSSELPSPFRRLLSENGTNKEAAESSDSVSSLILDVVDLSSFALLPYVCYKDATQLVRRWFPKDEFSVVHHTLDNSTTVFLDFYSPKHNISIISVRGTYSLWDVLSDLNLFYEVICIQLTSALLPVTGILPDQVIMWIIKYANTYSFDDMRYIDSAYGPLMAYVKDSMHGTNHTGIQEVLKGRKVILTGHSLGGAIADIVGSRLHVKAVTFSPPGVYWGSKKFGISSTDQIDRNVFSIVPERDVVPSIDRQRGLVQYITCPKGFSSVGCHNIILTLCNLHFACKDEQKPIFVPFPEFHSQC